LKQEIEAVKDRLNDVQYDLDQANEAVSLLSEKLEDVTAHVETEIRSIIESLEGAHKHRDIGDVITSLKELVKEL